MHHTLGLALLAEGRDTEALEQFRTAMGLAPDWSHPYIALAEVEARAENTATAERAYAQALILDSDAIAVRLSVARLLIGDERPKQALPHLQHALGLGDESRAAEIQSHLGLAYAGMKEHSLAVAHLRRSLALDPGNPRVHASLGLVFQQQGELDPALASYRRALEIDPELEGVHGNIGLILHQQGHDEEALQFLHRAAALGSQEVALDFTVYEIRLARGERREAIEALRSAHRKQPDGLRSMNDLAWHLATESDPALRDPEQARLLARQAVKQTLRTNPATLDTLAIAWAANGNFETALRVADEALTKARAQGNTALVAEITAHRREIEAGRVPRR
jgi:Tfp pilus assembly protein PilF